MKKHYVRIVESKRMFRVNGNRLGTLQFIGESTKTGNPSRTLNLLMTKGCLPCFPVFVGRLGGDVVVVQRRG